jgi:hypothetical protein
MDVIFEKHAGFITRLTKLLNLFVAMRYIFPSDVIHPPHSSSTVATNIFHKIGLDPEVIELIKLVPAMRSHIVEGYNLFGVEMAPRSKAVTYFADSSIPDFVEGLRWGERNHRTKLLPPCMMRLTSGSTYSDLLYDTHDRTSAAG